MKTFWGRYSKSAMANRRRAQKRRAARRTTPLRGEQLEGRNLLAALPAGIMAWYRAEGDAQDAADGNHGALVGGTGFAPGLVGQAFSFNGADDPDGLIDEVVMAHQSSQTFGRELTIEAWINPDSLEHGRPILQKRSGGNVGGFTLETTHNSFGGAPNGLGFTIWLDNFLFDYASVSTPQFSLSTGVWQHVAATFDGTVQKIYVNGAKVAEQDLSIYLPEGKSSWDIKDSTAPMSVGRNAVVPGFAWDGLIDELSLYNRALSQEEIQAIVDAGSAGKQAAIVVTTTADAVDASDGVTSLREAILASNASVGVLDTINFNIPQPTTEGLVSWYRGEGNASDSFGDNDGTLQNGANATAVGKYGQGFDFDGVNDAMDLGNWFNLQTFTIDLWVKPGDTQTEYANLIDNNHTFGINWTVQQDSTTTNRYIFGGGGPQGNVSFNLTANTWQHLALTRDASGFKQVYINGILVGSAQDSPLQYNGNQFLRLGRWGGGGRNWNGELDEVRIFDRALSAEEVLVNATEEPATGTGPLSIRPTSALPTITDPVIIDGYTQPGASPNTLADGSDAVILVELNGASAGVGVSGLVLAGGDSTVRGLAINRFDASGIRVESSDNVVAGNVLGGDVTGTQDLGNHEGVTFVGRQDIEPFYRADAQTEIGEEWNPRLTALTPDGTRTFLGQFGSETVTLTLDADSIDQDLNELTIAFDLYVIRTWDGNHTGSGSGPDRFTFSVGSDVLLDTTFSNGHPNSAAAGQAYPGSYPGGQFEPRTGADEVNSLGFLFGTDEFDSVYHFSFTLPYSGGDLVLNFTGALTTPGDDESWGLDNVEIFAGEPGSAATGNRIGGTSSEDRNIVAYSGGDGIRTEGEDVEVAIVGNSIFANGASGIDIDEENVDEPDILSLTSFPGELRIDGSLDAEPSTNYRIEFFASDEADEGQRLIGVRDVTTDAAGHVAFIHEAPTVADGQWITATATLIAGDGETLLDTSEFSDAVQVVTAGTADLAVTISDLPDPVILGQSVTYLVHVTNHGPAAATGVIVVASGPPGQPFNNVTIPIGGLASGGSSMFQLVFTPSVLGTFSVTATVDAGEDDPVTVNNTFTETTQVIPRLKFEWAQATYEVREGEEFAVLTVRRIGDLAGSARVDYATVGGTATQRAIRGSLTPVADYTPTNGTLFFRPRSNIASVRVPIRDDSTLEPDESFRVVLSNPSDGAQLGAITSADVTIHDNDPTLSFLAATSDRNEGVTGRYQIEVRLTPASNQTVTVTYAVTGGTATPGADYTLPRLQTLTFRPRETRKFIDFNNVNDSTYEGDETAVIELVSATNAFIGPQSRHRITIVENDPVPPPPDPGSTIDTALFLDLQTLPRQSYHELLTRINGSGDIDTYRVHLDEGEAVAIDVDPEGNPGFFVAGLGNSTLTILGSNGQTPDIQQLVVIGRSAEPDTGVFNNNPAHLFRAPATGDYYFQLQANVNGIFSYRMHFHRLGVAENVPAPELLNVPGSMFAWYEASTSGGDATVGITGPTGYGFTLKGPWQQQVSGSSRTILRSQTLTLPAGTRFTLKSRAGFEVPLFASLPIVIKTKSQRWGEFVGEVNSNAIDFPVGLDITPINDLIVDVFGSQIGGVGLLTGNWRISLGGKVLAVSTNRGLANTNAPIEQLLSGVPYLRQKGPINVDAALGPITISYPIVEKPVDWAFDPADPMLYLKGEELGQVKKPSLALSLHGLLEFLPQDEPNPLVNEGVTHIFGHIYGRGIFPIKVGPIPVDVDAEVVLNIDADRDGKPLGDLADAADVFDVLEGDFSELEEIVGDIQLGANGIAIATIPKKFVGVEVEMEAGRASVVLNGLTDTIWVRGQQGGEAFPNSPIEVGSSSVVYEGLIDLANDEFLYSVTASSEAAGILLAYNYTITHESLSVSITGSISWSVEIDYLAGTVGGKAKATINAKIGLEIDDNNDVYFNGSISATGKLSAKINGDNKTLFEDEIDADVRNKLFKFEFPRGVGSLSFDPFG